MNKKKLGISVLLVLLVVGVFGVVSGLVVVGEGGRRLSYENGTYVLLAEGTYDSVVRIDNVWYVDGVVVGEGLVSPTPTPDPTVVGESGLVGFALMSFLLCFNLVSLVWFRRVPLVVYLVGFFTFVVGVAVATSGFIGSEFGHYYVLFVVVMAGICMLLVGLGVRVGGRR